MDVGNDVFYQHTKFQLEISYILGCAKMTKYRSKVVNSINIETSKLCHFSVS
jgi:hypothetical protein